MDARRAPRARVDTPRRHRSQPVDDGASKLLIAIVGHAPWWRGARRLVQRSSAHARM
ncbi:Hypothetical protein A7982_06961 [Minicystis rosea]|nr:Hypothetical protein A7982_06961 [Minicystis rosea]